MGDRGHTWKFFRAGGVDQVVLATGEDLESLGSLDQKLWVALACPCKGLEFDARTLEFLDFDQDGRIRPPDILAAIAWLKERLETLDELFRAEGDLPLSAVATGTDGGKAILAGARLVLEGLGKEKSKAITLEDVSGTEAALAATRFNGDGVVPPDSADDDETRKAIQDILDVLGGVPDRSKKAGVDQAKVDAFFEQAGAYASWLEAGKLPGVQVLGESTAPAAAALEAVRAKVDDYFVRCRLVAFDPRAAASLNASDAELVTLGAHTLTADARDAASLPLARIEAGRALPLGEAVNPAWSVRLRALATVTVPAVLGAPRTSLTDADWTAMKEKLSPFVAWQGTRPATDVARLDGDRVASLVGGDARARITELIARDASVAERAKTIESVEKLIRLRKGLVPLLRNFVNFSAFYTRGTAVFQAGTLYLDARSCNLCLAAEDAARHALLDAQSQAYLVYCDCVRKDPAGKRSIVALVTGGDVDNIVVGRNGIFYDRQGADWDATITKVVENPISLRQAVFLPYRRFVRMVGDTFAKRAKAADEQGAKKVEAAAVTVGSAGSAPEGTEPEKKAPPAAKPFDVGTIAAMGVAIGGIATFFSSAVATFLGLGMWMPLGLVVLALAVSGPSVLLAWLKLRHRNIGPILDANGWAVNAVVRVNVPFGGALTDLAALPPGASRASRDPFAEKKTPWVRYLLVALVLAALALWWWGKLDSVLPTGIRSTTLLR
jgi:hypothetical protein